MRRVDVRELLGAEADAVDEIERRVAAYGADVALVDETPEPAWLARVQRHRGGVVAVAGSALRTFFDDVARVPLASRDDEHDLLRRVEVLRVRRRQLLLATAPGLRTALARVRPTHDLVEEPDRVVASAASARRWLAEGRIDAADRAFSECRPRAALLLDVAGALDAAEVPPGFAAAHAEVLRVEGWLWAHEARLVVEAVRERHRADLAAYPPAIDRGLTALDDAVGRYSHRFGGRLSAYVSADVRAAVRGS